MSEQTLCLDIVTLTDMGEFQEHSYACLGNLFTVRGKGMGTDAKNSGRVLPNHGY